MPVGPPNEPFGGSCMRHHRSGAAAVMAAVASFSFAVASCGGADSRGPAGIATAPTGSTPGSSSLTLSSTTDTLLVDQSLALTAVVPGNAATAAPVWGSSDATVATVSQSGLVLALKSGRTTVTISSRGASASKTITVKPSVRV